MLSTVVIVGCLLGLAGCSVATPDMLALPMTVAPVTAEAWHSGPTKTKLQAALAAQSDLYTTRLHYTQPPQIIFVEQMGSLEAQRRMRTIDALMPGIDAWLVIFEGDYQIFGPPGPTSLPVVTPTPIPTVHGCAYIILSAADGAPMSDGTLRTCQP
jgi:hypothetical protein